MTSFYYNRHQLKAFCEDLPKVFVELGFEIAEEPYIDYSLCGFRATYIRRYVLHQPTTLYDGILTTIIHTVGIPFGHNGQKMVVLSAPRTLKNEPVSETLKLRIHFDDDGTAHVVHNELHQQRHDAKHETGTRNSTTIQASMDYRHDTYLSSFENDLAHGHQHELSIFRKMESPYFDDKTIWDDEQDIQFIKDLTKYVKHIIEVISPGLIELPFDMKLEILKKLSVDSIIKMSQVNNEFRTLIFKHGESLWRHLCYRDFKIKFINRLVHKTWMELYRDTYLLHQIEICRKERALPGLPERLALPPVPYRFQIEWLPEVVLALPFHPLNRMGRVQLHDNHPLLALEFHPMHRAGSLDSLS
jgi:hypothetical protein